MAEQPTRPFATIAIPTFNRARLLQAAVNSALSQDCGPVEVIIVDNASTDNTEAVGRAIAEMHPSVRYIRHASNLGPVRNFEAGLQNARGKYFMWLADDDWITPNYIRRCVEVLERENHAVVVGQDWWRSEALSSPEPILTALQSSPQARIISYLWAVTSNAPVYGVCRTDTAIANLPFPTGLGGDWIWTLSLLNCGTLDVVPDASLYRDADSESRDLRYYAKQLELGPFGRLFPASSEAWNVLLALCDRRRFQSDGLTQRLFFATRAALIVWIRIGVIGQRACLTRFVSQRVIPKSWYRGLRLRILNEFRKLSQSVK